MTKQVYFIIDITQKNPTGIETQDLLTPFLAIA